jgi:imidazolonepropionase-like amidohydrolase
MQVRHTMFEPTLVVIMRLNARYSTDTTRQYLWGMDQWSAAFARAAHAGGVPIVAGTDLMGSPARDTVPAIHDELAYLVSDGGLSPIEAIGAATATAHGARALGVDRELGTIEVGKIADLVVLSADPTRNIRNTRAIRLVVKGGVIYERRWPQALVERREPYSEP